MSSEASSDEFVRKMIEERMKKRKLGEIHERTPEPAPKPDVPATPSAPPTPIPKTRLPPAPIELTPLTDRLDTLAAKLDAITDALKPPKGKPVALADRYSGADTVYQKVVSWTVGDLWGLRRGRIEEISLYSSNFSKTRFRFTVMNIVLFGDLQLPRALSLPFPKHEIPFGKKIVIECKSSDGTSITVDGTITGVEY